MFTVTTKSNLILYTCDDYNSAYKMAIVLAIRHDENMIIHSPINMTNTLVTVSHAIRNGNRYT